MWGTIGKWVLNTLVVPLLMKLVDRIIGYFENKVREEKLKKENQEKVKKYVEAKSDKDIIDAYSNLP